MFGNKKKHRFLFFAHPLPYFAGRKKKIIEWQPQEYDIEDKESASHHKSDFRPLVFYIIIAVAGFVFLYKLLNLQIVYGQEHRLLAEDNRIRAHLIEAPRGQITDRSGNSLVQNKARYIIQIYPYNLPKLDDARKTLVDKINKELRLEKAVEQGDLDYAQLTSFDPIVLKEDLSQQEVIHYRNVFSRDSAIEVVAKPKREYLENAALAHLIGYTGKMSEEDVGAYPNYPASGTIGKTGIEATYDSYLRGQPGERQVEIDNYGRLQREVKDVPAQIGTTLKLYLSLDLQKVLYQSLSQAIQDSGGKSGAAIALDPKTGGIVSFVSLPDYDSNIFSGKVDGKQYQKLLDDEKNPLLNRAISGLFPPGSTIKPYVAASALDAGVIDESTTIATPSEIKIGDWVFPDWKPHGSADVKKAIAESNNIFFYALGGGYDKIQGLGSEKLKKYLEKFGFGSETGIDIPGENHGLVPDREWKKKTKGENWYVGDTYHMAIGQGDLVVTPIEIAVATAAIANGGTLYEPRSVQSVIASESSNVVKNIAAQIRSKNIISDDYLRVVRDGMRRTIVSGSGHSTFGSDFPMEVAGKTGTAQFGNKEKTHAWFTSFAPYSDPKLVVTVFIESGGEGYQTAAPVAKAAYRWYSDNINFLD